MGIVGVVDVIALENGGVLHIWSLVNAPWELLSRGHVRSLPVGEPIHIFTLYSWDVPPVAYKKRVRDGEE